MMKPLRKRHLQIWTLWAVLLPAGIITAWLSIPVPSNETLLQPVAGAPLQHIAGTVNREAYTLHLRTNHEKNQWQLEWINKKVLTVPTATIYKLADEHDDIKKGELLGRIEARGTYRFLLKDSAVTSLNLVVFDFIHGKNIDKIKITASAD